ncbi:MAG: SHOCT domain-containing protein [Dehalococcoidia bacterium]|nr:SHOCT domain-containing protein [Dehalococcoidia bacterium]
MWDHGSMWGGGWGFVPMLFGSVFPLLLLGLLVFLLVQAFSGQRAPAPPAPGVLPPPPRGETAIEIAERRYAAGELSRDEFLRIREDLAGSGGTTPAPSP